MGTLFNAHIFKDKQVGDREEVRLKIFGADGNPLDLGGGDVEPVDLSTAVLSAWKGDFVDGEDYEAGSLVRRSNVTYLALVDAPHDGLKPGETLAMNRAAYYQNGDRNAYVLRKNVLTALEGLEGGSGYNIGGVSKWFQIQGPVGENITIEVVGGQASPMAFYLSPSGQGPFPSPKTVDIPAGGLLNVEVHELATSIRYYTTSEGPQPVTGNSWVRFA